MIRRDFFKSLAACAAALAVPAAAPAAVPAIRRAANVLTADQRTAIDLLAECSIQSVEEVRSLHGPARYIVSYLHKPNGERTSLDEEYGFLRTACAPASISVSLSAEAGELNVSHLGDYRSMPIYEPQITIDVEWVQ
jgi:hypothetical protein